MTLRAVPGDIRQEMEALVADTRSAMVRTVQTWIDLGIRYSAVKAQLPHGEWTNWVQNEVPISYRSVRQLMQIAGDENICNNSHKMAHDAILPSDRIVLCELCGLEKGTFDTLIESGDIHADMRRGDVRAAIAALDRPDTTATLGVQAVTAPGTYGAILADPPWRFETRGRGGDRLAETHYPTMSFEDICALPVGDLAARDCALFLWITTEQLMRAREVMEAWGFVYKTVAFVWRKTSGPIGLGYWTRKRTEMCLLGVRGQPHRIGADVEDIIEAPRGVHSAKPEEQYDRIERLVPGPYLELFARRLRPSWNAWGNDPALDVSDKPQDSS